MLELGHKKIDTPVKPEATRVVEQKVIDGKEFTLIENTETKEKLVTVKDLTLGTGYDPDELMEAIAKEYKNVLL